MGEEGWRSALGGGWGTWESLELCCGGLVLPALAGVEGPSRWGWGQLSPALGGLVG